MNEWQQNITSKRVERLEKRFDELRFSLALSYVFTTVVFLIILYIIVADIPL